MINGEGDIKVVDFGIAKKIVQRRKMFAGTPGFIPPENFKKEYLGYQGDVFSVGVILYLMLTNEYPYTARHS